MTVVAAVIGAGLAAGILLVVSGVRSTGARTEPHAMTRPITGVGIRAGLAVGAAVLAGLVTRWPTAAVAAGVAGWFAPQLSGGGAARQRAVARSEAIATWTEMLRDTLAAAHGLEEAIAATAPLVPTVIRPELSAMTAAIDQVGLSAALTGLAAELADPTADLVVTALVLAAKGQAQDLGELLGALAVTAREEATMRLRVDAARARTRTAVRVILAVTAAMAAALVVFNRAYLAPYRSVGGQAVLVVVFAAFGAAGWWLAQMARYQAPERFLTGQPAGEWR